MIAFHPEFDRLKSVALEKHVLQAQIDKVNIFNITDILKRERKIK